MQANDDPFDNTILRVLAISPAGQSICHFSSPTKLLEALRDAIKVHKSLFIDGNILHRDISENNIIITDPKTANGSRGILIDLDLAKDIGSGRSGARHRTGTMQFMAIQVLQGISHTYCHDLESFFYVLVWLSPCKAWDLPQTQEKRPALSRLTNWSSGSYDNMARTKRGDMNRKGFEGVLEQFPSTFEGVKSLCRTLRDILFPYKDGLFTGTPENPEILYIPIIEAFSEALEAIGKGNSGVDVP